MLYVALLKTHKKTVWSWSEPFFCDFVHKTSECMRKQDQERLHIIQLSVAHKLNVHQLTCAIHHITNESYSSSSLEWKSIHQTLAILTPYILAAITLKCHGWRLCFSVGQRTGALRTQVCNTIQLPQTETPSVISVGLPTSQNCLCLHGIHFLSVAMTTIERQCYREVAFFHAYWSQIRFSDVQW